MLGEIWSAWERGIDRHPFKVLFVLFFIVWVYEYVGHGVILETVILFIITLTTSIFLSVALKLIFKEKRGEIKKVMDYRRPSAHTLIATALSTVASLMDWSLFPLMVVFTLSTAIARHTIGAHTKREIVEGFAFGLLTGIALFFCFQILTRSFLYHMRISLE